MADLIDRDAVAYKVKSCITIPADSEWDSGYNTAMAEAKQYIQNAPAVNRWISVEDALPEQSGTYLVYIDSGEVFNCTFESDIEDESKFGFWHPYYDNNTLGYIDSEWHPIETVTHWMPMPPEPPEKE